MWENRNLQCLEQGNVFLDISKVVFRRCSPEWNMPAHRSDNANLTFLVSGEADYILGGALHRTGAGDLIYVPKDDLRQATLAPENPMRCYSIDFNLRDASGHILTLPLPYVSNFCDSATVNDLCSRINASWLQNAPYQQLHLKALLMQLLYHILTAQEKPEKSIPFSDDRITSMTTCIARRYGDNLCLETFANQLNLSKVYLGVLFKRQTGLSFHQYLTNARLNAAEDLLCSGKYTINEVSYLAGFQDPSYFSRVFYKMYGVRPGKYKRIEKPQEPEP